MQNRALYFWKNWPNQYQAIFFILGSLFVITLSFMWYYYLQYPEPSYQFQTIQEAELAEIPAHRFTKGIFNLGVAGNNYIIYERLLGTPFQVSATGAYLFLGLLLAGMVVFLAVFTTMGHFYYLVCMGVFILFVVSLRMEVLAVFGVANKTFTIATLAVFSLASLYMYYFAKALSFTKRLLVFGGLTILFLGVVYVFANVELPFYHLASNGSAAGIVLTGLFIIMVSHEIIAAFIHLVTQGTRTSKSLNHFLIITLIYFINLAVSYAVKFKMLHWNIVTVDLFLLFTISAILGVWGIRQRQKQFEGILDTDPFGVLAFLAMGGIAFATLLWFFQSGNDPVTEAISDLIIFSHIGYGLIFLTYILSNFISMLAQNMAVHKVLYNPNNMPYFTFRLGGLIVTLAFTFYNQWQVPVQNAVAGYYNTAGDLYLSVQNFELSKAFYERSSYYGYDNHHANYALANLAAMKMNIEKERTHYESAASRRPTEMAVLNWAQTYQTERNNIQALLALKDAKAKFPGSGAIQNTMGYLFLKTGAIDSAGVYFQQASRGITEQIAQSNIMAMSAQYRIPFALRDTTAQQQWMQNISYQSNLLARLNFNQQEWKANLQLTRDTALTTPYAAYLNNYLINQKQLDTALLDVVEKLARRPVNASLSEPLLFALSLANYKAGEVHKAYQLLEEVTIGSSDPGKYNNILALWTLEQSETNRAFGYITYARNQNYKPANLTRAVILTEGKRIPEALAAWDSLRAEKDSITSTLAARMTMLLQVGTPEIFRLGDEDKYAFCRYRIPLADSTLFNDVVSTMVEEDWKAKALLERSKSLLALDNPTESIGMFKRIRGLQVSKELYDEIVHHELVLLGEQKDFTALRERLAAQSSFDGEKKCNKIYFDALLAEAAGDTATASQLYQWLGKSNFFFDEGVVASAIYQKSHSKDQLIAYNLLVEALQIHPTSVRLRKAYCLESARVGFSDFAFNTLSDLRTVLPPRDYQELELEVQQILDSIEID